MDKYEFNNKIEQLRKQYNRGDYETAMKIADTIDWNKVPNANLLSMVASIYEKNQEYADAKDILLLAFERAPIGRRLLYKLTDLALKEGSIEEAEAYYREFCEMAGDDPRQHLLRYLILQKMQAPIEQRIHSLECYTAEELDEKRMYELAELYSEAGNIEQCVSQCDRIMLMFGLGKYVDKAMELKTKYAPLNQYQQDLVENREMYEEKFRAVEQGYDYEADGIEESCEESLEEGTESEDQVEMIQEEAEFEVSQERETQSEETWEEDKEQIFADPIPGESQLYEAAVDVRQAEIEASLAKEMSRLKDVPIEEAEDMAGKTRVLSELRRIRRSPLEAEKPEENEFEEIQDLEEELPKITNHLMIEARNPEKGLELAVRTLKQIQKETGVKNPVAKIKGSRLNKRGILASIDKLAGKDLIIEEAGDLSPGMLGELERLMEQDATGMRIVLIDNPKQMETLHGQNPSLADRFECIGCDYEEAMTQKTTMQSVEKTAHSSIPIQKNNAGQDVLSSSQRQAGKKAIYQKALFEESKHTAVRESNGETSKDAPVLDGESRPVRRVVPETSEAMRIPDPELDYSMASDRKPSEMEMDIDEFAQCCCKYAASIDCVVTGKSMLALYERIEIMEEKGIPLVKSSAIDVIEEAADRADSPSLWRRVRGMFSPKYNKSGMLILREEHFIWRD